jgi:hypothetical protein
MRLLNFGTSITGRFMTGKHSKRAGRDGDGSCWREMAMGKKENRESRFPEDQQGTAQYHFPSIRCYPHVNAGEGRGRVFANEFHAGSLLQGEFP